MRTVRRLLNAELVSAIAFVMVSFLALFVFIDLVNELDDLGRGRYRLPQALAYCLMRVPRHVYELLPIATLIGATYALARLAQSSEFTILRTSGLGPGRALGLLSRLGLLLAALTLAVGELLLPWAEGSAETLHAEWRGTTPKAGRQGAWLKDRRSLPDGQTALDTVRVERFLPDGRFEGLRLYVFDPEGRLVQRLEAARATLQPGAWRLESGQRLGWRPAEDGRADLPAPEPFETLDWPTTLTPALVVASIRPSDSLSLVDLWRYMGHLDDKAQAAQRPAIQFWKKALYPLACLVMLALALPFAYLHARRGGLSLKVFGGILLGISFVLLNNISGHLGLLRGWTPWLAAGAPSAVYLLLSLGAFAWLVRHR